MGIKDSLSALGIATLCIGASIAGLVFVVYLVVTVAKWAWGG